jgi:HPt (histidine-containing phosphotransfer) domain-containing protein
MQRIESLKTAMGDKSDEIMKTYIDNSYKNIKLIQANINSGDQTILYRAAHSRKGSSGTMGATELSKHSLDLELAVKENNSDIDALVARVVSLHTETVAQIKKLIGTPH